MNELLEILYEQNPWGSVTLDSGFPRDATHKITSYVDIPEVITLIGPRRAGKTTVLFQIIGYLEQNVNVKSILHVNFEDPFFVTQNNTTILDDIYDTYRNHIYPEGKAYIFFDEIQNITGWERWVRSKNDKGNIKIFITGSSAQLMSRELGTLLTGRHLTFNIYPLDFSEFLKFKNITIPNKPFPGKAPAIIQHALNEYINWGGFPRVVLTQDNELKLQLLKRYFDDIIYKDIILRHQIRDAHLLRNIAAHLLTQTASLISYQRIANIFGVSQDVAANYSNYLMEGFFVNFLQYYSLKASERNRNPKKCHAVDLGLRRSINISQSPDIGRTMETCVHNKLLQNHYENIFYHKESGEIDFLTREGNNVTNLIQVVHKGLDNPKILARETNSLHEASKKFPNANKLLIIGEPPKTAPEIQDIQLIPLWQFLLQ